VRVREREGPLCPGDAYERDGRPEGLAFERYFTPPAANVADSNPMWRADGSVLRKASGGVKVAIERINGRGVGAEEER
jgi:hypothetical protein